MPCYDPRSNECRTIEVPVRMPEDIDALNKYARICCDMRTILRREGLEKELTTETREWIKEHDKFDEERIKKENEEGERERVRINALDRDWETN